MIVFTKEKEKEKIIIILIIKKFQVITFNQIITILYKYLEKKSKFDCIQVKSW